MDNRGLRTCITHLRLQAEAVPAAGSSQPHAAPGAGEPLSCRGLCPEAPLLCIVLLTLLGPVLLAPRTPLCPRGLAPKLLALRGPPEALPLSPSALTRRPKALGLLELPPKALGLGPRALRLLGRCPVALGRREALRLLRLLLGLLGLVEALLLPLWGEAGVLQA